MRRQTVGTPFGVLFAFYLLALLFFLVRSIFTFPSRELLGVFLWPYVWSNTFLELMRHVIPITMAGAAVSYSLLSSPPTRGRTPFHRVISSHLAGMVSLAVLYTALLLGLQPRVHGNYEQLFSLSAQARTYLSQAESALDTGDRRSAVLSYERYLAINGEDRDVQSRAADLRTELYGEDEGRGPGGQESAGREAGDRARRSTPPDDLTEGLSPPELVGRAESFLSAGDYFSAYYYADLAAQTDPRRADARRLAAQAREMIRRFDRTAVEEQQARVFEEKRRGFELYNTGQYVKSYRVFHALNQEVPRDREVARYLEASRSRLASQAFFVDEAQAAELMPGAEKLLFLNPRHEDLWEVVYLGRMAGTPEGVYFADIEVAGFTSQALLYHYGAPYGKLYEGQINFHGIDRREPGIETRSAAYRGSAPTQAGEVPDMLPLVPGPGLLSTLKIERGSLEALSFFMLWRVRSQIAAFGHLEAPIGQEILTRTLLPFCFLVLALVGMSVGWRFRAESARRPRWPGYLLVPAFPLVAMYLGSFYIGAQQVILGFVMVRFSFLAALIVLVGLQALALFLALIALAGQRAD